MIIQFFHSGKQYVITNPGIAVAQYQFFPNNPHSGLYYWNNQGFHRRKCLKSLGDYKPSLDAAPINGAQIVFWGEWEPHSVFHFVPDHADNGHHPRHIHEPFFSREREGVQNTDPFVFGDRFLYSNCLQSKPLMQNVPNESLILFGSEIYSEDAINFVLDTVFVVQESIPINRRTVQAIRERTSQIFVDAVLRTINLDANHRLYFSAPWSENRQGYFSYVPCKQYQQGVVMLRPVIPIQEFHLRRPGAYQGVYKITCNDAQQYWLALTKFLLRHGYSLGIKTYLPETVNILETYGQNFA